MFFNLKKEDGNQRTEEKTNSDNSRGKIGRDSAKRSW